MRNFRDLKVWEKAHKLTLDVYAASLGFPDSEKYGLTSQVRRACASIPTNIAEGCGRDSNADFARFLQIALGSASEVDYLLLLLRDLDMLDAAIYQSLNNQTAEVKRMLIGFLQHLRRQNT